MCALRRSSQPCWRKFCKCFTVSWLTSRNRSVQFAMQLFSVLSKVPLLTEPVTPFRKHMSVKL